MSVSSFFLGSIDTYKFMLLPINPKKKNTAKAPRRVSCQPWMKNTKFSLSRERLRPHPRFLLSYDISQYKRESEKENWKLFSHWKRKTFRLHKQFFSVIDWQKVESGFQAFLENWNRFFPGVCGCCFAKVFFTLSSELLTPGVKFCSLILQQWTPEGWNIREKIPYRKGVLG